MQSNWQADFFSGVALEFWRRAIHPEQTLAEVDFLGKALQLGHHATLLDVPCGNGRHALELTKRGHQVTGVGSSEEFLAEARAATWLPVRWILGDMRELPWRAEFDGTFCFGNSFGYLDHPGACKFLASVAATLRPGGKFVVETGMAAESILPALGKGRHHRLGDMIVVSENRYHPEESRLDIDYTFIHQGNVETRPTSSYCFTTSVIRRMHTEAGLDPVELLSSLRGDPYELGSPRLLLVSQKR